MAMQPVLSHALLSHTEDQLGSLVETYRTRVTLVGVLVSVEVVGLAILFIGGSFEIFRLLVLPFISSLLFVFIYFVVPMLFVGALFAFLCWQLRAHDSIVTPLRRKIVVRLYEKGFIYREGRKRYVIIWEQIRSIERLTSKHWYTQPRHYKVNLADTAFLSLPLVITDVQKLGTAIEQAIVARLLPDVLADYAAQKPIVFPGLCLNQNMVSKSDESLLWPEVDQIILTTEQFAIKERWIAEDWLTLPVVQLRNMCVLEALLEHIKEEKGFSIVRDRADQTRKAGRTLKASHEQMG